MLGVPDKDPLSETSSRCFWQSLLLTPLCHFPGCSMVMILLWSNRILEQTLSIRDFRTKGHCLLTALAHLGSHGLQTVASLL